MSTVKPSKLFTAFEKHKGTQKTLAITSKDMNIAITGEIHKIDDQYCITRGAGKVLIEREKTGSLLSWKGTYRKYVVKFVVGNETLAEFEIPEKARLSLDDLDVSDET